MVPDILEEVLGIPEKEQDSQERLLHIPEKADSQERALRIPERQPDSSERAFVAEDKKQRPAWLRRFSSSASVCARRTPRNRADSKEVRCRLSLQW